MAKNILVRFYNYNVNQYGQPFAICAKGYEMEKNRWPYVGEKIGTTDWPCNNHKDHKTLEPFRKPVQGELK